MQTTFWVGLRRWETDWEWYTFDDKNETEFLKTADQNFDCATGGNRGGFSTTLCLTKLPYMCQFDR